MKRHLWITAIIVIIGCVSIAAIYSNESNIASTQTHSQVSTKNDKKPALVKMTTPQYLIVPSLDIEKSIVGVGLTQTGDMDAPSDNDTLGWYMNNPAPGNTGAAVLAAHAGPPDNPSVFQKLQTLTPGALIEVKDAAANTAMFEVTETGTYSPESAPRERIFKTSSKKPQLSIITCTGEWSPSTQTYSHRFVVYADRKL